MSRTAWFHCFSGITGAMALGALLDAGADEAAVRDHLGKLPLTGWRLDVGHTDRGGVRATRAAVVSEAAATTRLLPHVHAIVRGAGLPVEVRERALAVFDRIAIATGRLRGLLPDAVPLDGVGADDAVVTVVGVCAALHILGIDRMQSSAIAQAHGDLPAPVTMALLTGVPTYGLDVDAELTTPTGAALMSTLASGFGPLPALTASAVGYGAGAREVPGRPNVTQVVVGEAGTDDALGRGVDALLLEVNAHEPTGETLGRLLEAGARDAWITPLVAAAGSSTHTVHALCDPALAARVADVLTRESGSLGVRGTRIERWPQARDDAIVDIDGQPVRVRLDAGRVKVEHDDAAAAAWALGVPLRDVLARAEAAGLARG